MDAFYIFQHSKHGDEELRYSLRSVAQHAPWIRKVWIFGDRPLWLASRPELIEHVPHERIAWVIGVKTPVVNTFLMMWLSALLPEVDSEYLWFCDDYVLLQDLDVEVARQQRIVEDLTGAQLRHRGLYKDAVWRTFDLLRRFNFPGLNFEVHAPIHLKKRWILDAAARFRDFMTEDRFYGLLAKMAVLNHAHQQEGFKPVPIAAEGRYIGFHDRSFSREEIVTHCLGKTFLNFDDDSFDVTMQGYLKERFQEPCLYEHDDRGILPASPASPRPIEVRASAPAEGIRLGPEDRPLGMPDRPDSHSPLPPTSACVVLVPYQEAIAPQCQAGLEELERRGYVVRRARGRLTIDQERNQLATDALRDGFEETLWIDGDLGFDANDVETLRRHRLPLCAAVCPKKQEPSLAIHVLPDTTRIVIGKGGGLHELLYSSGGFLHVRRHVYETIESQWKLPVCNGPSSRPFVPYFQPLVREWKNGNWYLAEDFAFCHRARCCGFPIFADTTIRLSRVWNSPPTSTDDDSPRADREFRR
ncbi:MAG: hypothetical protein P4L84_04140 [Isosphaeraceae bacterium]|nr:hypothetical protein [Isosphaeraceae bacterium]